MKSQTIQARVLSDVNALPVNPRKLYRSTKPIAWLCWITCLSLTLGADAEAVKQEEVSYQGWPNCIRLTNGEIELIATTDVGPRIIRLAFNGEENLFKEWPEQLGKTGGSSWRIYGGHRFWHAPEVRPRTYAPDNSPVKHQWDGKTLTLTQPTESSTRVQKEIEITLAPNRNRVEVLHRLINHNPWEIEVAPWALSVMQGPGRVIVPQEPKSDQLLPVRAIALWGYTEMGDPRWTWGNRYIQLESDPEANDAEKFGVRNSLGWSAYVPKGRDDLFIKRYPERSDAEYPDFGCNAEFYTNGDMLEVETLGPLVDLPPEASVEHVERWFLFQQSVGRTEDAIDEALSPLIEKTASQ